MGVEDEDASDEAITPDAAVGKVEVENADVTREKELAGFADVLPRTVTVLFLTASAQI